MGPWIKFVDSLLNEVDPPNGPPGAAPSIEDYLLQNLFLLQPGQDTNPNDYPPVPTGISTTLDGPYLDPSTFLYDGMSASELSSIPPHYLFACQVGGIGSVGPTIQVLLTGGDGTSQTIQLNQQSDGTYLSALPILAFNGDLDTSLRASMAAAWGLVIVHNAVVTAKYGNTVTNAGTATLTVDVAHQQPNLLPADGVSTTVIVFQDLKKRAGLGIQFGVDNGSIDFALKRTDANGIATATYTSALTTCVATVNATVEGKGLEIETFAYIDTINFQDLSKNAGMAGYTDAAVVDSNALSPTDIQNFLQDQGSFLKDYSDPTLGTAAAIISKSVFKNAAEPGIVEDGWNGSHTHRT